MERKFTHIERFLEMLLAERSATMNTVKSYRYDLQQLFDFAKQQNVSSEISMSEANIRGYISSLHKKKLAPSTIARKICATKHFFGFLESEGLIKGNPSLRIEAPKRSKMLPSALTEEEISKMFDTCYGDESKEGVRLSAMMEVLYSSGMRVSELLTLKLSHLQKNISGDEDVWALLISGKGKRERLAILNAQAIEVLKKYMAVRKKFIHKKMTSDYLFPSVQKNGKMSHLTRQRFTQLIKKLAIDSGINPSQVSPHKIRHSFATHMLRNGANLREIQELLGHRNISSTQIYTKIHNDDLREAVLSKHPLGAGHG